MPDYIFCHLVSKRGGVNLEGPHVGRNVQEVVLILWHVDVVGETIVDLLIVVFARENNSIRKYADFKGRLFSDMSVYFLHVMKELAEEKNKRRCRH